MSEMIVNSLVPWFGQDRGNAADTVREFGKHSAFWDLCCGGLPELLLKPVSTHETVVDLHGDLINLAMVVASDAWADLRDKLVRTWHSRAAFDAAKASILAEPDWDPPTDLYSVRWIDIRRAYQYWVFSWHGINGLSGTANANVGFALRYTPGGGGGGRRIKSAADSIDAIHERLRSVTIEHKDIFEILPRIADEPGVVVYVDPPFVVKGCRYRHDFEGSPTCLADEDGQPIRDDDGKPLVLDAGHVRLAAELGRFEQVRVVVRYYDHPAVRALYPSSRWTWRHRSKCKGLVQSARREKGGKSIAPEVLLINGESYVEQNRSLFDEEAA